MIATPSTPKRRRSQLSWDELDLIYRATLERRIDLGFGALAAEKGLAITSEEMFKRIYLAVDEESGARAAKMGSILLCHEVGISKEELDTYLESEGADQPPDKLAATFLQ